MRPLVLLQRRKSTAAGSAPTRTASVSSDPHAKIHAPPPSRELRLPAMVDRCFIARVPKLRARTTPRISRDPSRTVNEDRPEIVHVGIGRPRHQEVINPFKEFRRIV